MASQILLHITLILSLSMLLCTTECVALIILSVCDFYVYYVSCVCGEIKVKGATRNRTAKQCPHMSYFPPHTHFWHTWQAWKTISLFSYTDVYNLFNKLNELCAAALVICIHKQQTCILLIPFRTNTALWQSGSVFHCQPLVTSWFANWGWP